MMMKHICIKCKKNYEDEDPDDYYCQSCVEVKKKIASDVDKKFASIPRKPVVSALKEYDMAKKFKGFMIYNG